MILHFTKNTAGRDFAVGDVHGHFTRLQAALNSVNFNPKVDRLFSVGDLVDRGPESHLAIEWIEKPWFHAITGNHEDMAIRWPSGNMDSENYAANGGGWNVANIQAERVRFSDAFATLPLAIEVETEGGLIGIVHADCPFPSWQQFKDALAADALPNKFIRSVRDCCMWSRERIEHADETPVAGLRALVVGHTPLAEPVMLGNVIHIDTGGWHRGYFTLLDLSTLQPIQCGQAAPGTWP